jgi:hypothetical protein
VLPPQPGFRRSGVSGLLCVTATQHCSPTAEPTIPFGSVIPPSEEDASREEREKKIAKEKALKEKKSQKLIVDIEATKKDVQGFYVYANFFYAVAAHLSQNPLLELLAVSVSNGIIISDNEAICKFPL